jgi:2-polyprenyl-3-methyl-5-hydroxy-6-metoxy-1,4-benzoquinol methylase
MPLTPNENLADSRYEYVGKLLAALAKQKPDAVVFDIGAGDCKMRPIVEAAGLKWIGFDFAPSEPAVRKWDLVDPCPLQDVKADVALLLDVIEHLFNPGIAMTHIAEVLKPDGMLVLTMPNPHWSRSRIHHVLHGTLACFTQQDLDRNHHVFPPLRHVIERLLQDSNLAIERYVTLDGNEIPWPKARFSLSYPVLCAEALGRKLIEWKDAAACGMSYALIARPQNATPRRA